MPRRIVALFTALSVVMCFLCYRIYDITQSSYAAAQRSGSTVTVQVSKTRGIFYDCNMKRITNREKEKRAAIVPTPQALAAIYDYFSAEEADLMMKRLSKGKPIVADVCDGFPTVPGVTVFEVDKRYGGEAIAPHIIGYLDSGGQNGVSGLEKVFNEQLKSNEDTTEVTYDVDALGRVLAGRKPEISRSISSQGGVKLTIDADIQRIAQNAARRIPSGAIVVTETQTGAIRAAVSTPAFDYEKIGDSLKDESSPFINRAFRGYSLGSVFKIVTAAAALENRILLEEPFDCTGSILVGENEFRCYRGMAHGEVTMQTALEKSCNSYFISLALRLGKDRLLTQAEKMGFGQANVLADGYASDAGLLPKSAQVDSEAALANLAFGQGELLVTPLQAAAMLSCIANGGYYAAPYMVEGMVAPDGTVKDKETFSPRVRVISSGTSEILSRWLVGAMQNNYSRVAAPVYGGAGGKTATAQSGWFRGGREVLHTWFAGFYPAQNPKYTVVIMNEDGRFGASDCCPVFKEIADAIYAGGFLNRGTP